MAFVFSSMVHLLAIMLVCSAQAVTVYISGPDGWGVVQRYVSSAAAGDSSLSSNLLVWYKFDSDFTDSSGNGYTATNYGAVLADGYITTKGTNDFVMLPGVPDYLSRGTLGLLGSESWTLSMWYKGTNETIPPGDGGAQWGFGLVAWTNQNLMQSQPSIWRGKFAYPHYSAVDGYTTNPQASTSISDNNWHLLTAVNKTNWMSLYVDGAYITNGASDIRTYYYQPHTLLAGVYGGFLGASLDDVRIWTNALSPASCGNLFTEGRK